MIYMQWKIAKSGSDDGIARGSYSRIIANSPVQNFYVPDNGKYGLYILVPVGRSPSTVTINTLRLGRCKFVPNYILDMKTGDMRTLKLPALSVRYAIGEALSSTSTYVVANEDIISVAGRTTTLKIVLPAVDNSEEGRTVEVLNPKGSSVTYTTSEEVLFPSVSGSNFPSVGQSIALPINQPSTAKQVRFMCHNVTWYVIWIQL